jgi:NADH:quinone reductase (non-electrogenic)
MSRSRNQPKPRHRVVVVGGGFGGLQAALRLRRAPVDVTLIDRRNFHLFQPLLYQVAAGAVSAAEVAQPLRSVFRRQQNVSVILGEVTRVDLERRRVLIDGVGDTPAAVAYDTLIVAAGSRYIYFGHDEWRPFAPEIKTLEGALDTRRRILRAFEAAELERDPARRAAWLTFVVVGAGPTGVEIAGQIAEIARETLRRDFRAIDPRDARIVIVDRVERVLATFPVSLSTKAERALQRLGITALLGRTVVGIDDEGVTLQATPGARERVPARTTIWAAGVGASPLAGSLAQPTGAELDRTGRITVEPDLSLPGHPEVLALGDMVRVRTTDGEARALPGIAPVAMQQGRYAARLVRDRLRGAATPPFRYVDKGNLATIGRARAVAEIRGLRLSGLPAWLTWLAIHLFYLIGFQNRLLVLTRWAITFLTRGRGARLIAHEERAVGSLTSAHAPDRFQPELQRAA